MIEIEPRAAGAVERFARAIDRPHPAAPRFPNSLRHHGRRSFRLNNDGSEGLRRQHVLLYLLWNL